jgi:hypothetical protein
MRSGILANSGPIFIERDIAYPMNFVFDRPVIAVELEHSCGRALLRRKALRRSRVGNMRPAITRPDAARLPEAEVRFSASSASLR